MIKYNQILEGAIYTKQHRGPKKKLLLFHERFTINGPHDYVELYIDLFHICTFEQQNKPKNSVVLSTRALAPQDR